MTWLKGFQINSQSLPKIYLLSVNPSKLISVVLQTLRIFPPQPVYSLGWWLYIQCKQNVDSTVLPFFHKVHSIDDALNLSARSLAREWTFAISPLKNCYRLIKFHTSWAHGHSSQGLRLHGWFAQKTYSKGLKPLYWKHRLSEVATIWNRISI